MNLLLRLAVLLLPALPLAAAPLGSIRDVLALTPEQAAQRQPVELQALLLVDDRYRSTFFFHDGTASCYARIPGALHSDVLKRGNRYRIQGVTEPGGYRPVIAVTTLLALGPGTEPDPAKLSGADVFKTTHDAQWVEIEGRVTSSSIKEGGPCLDLAVEGQKIDAFLPREVSQPASPLWHLIGQRLRVRGVAASVFNDERQLTRRFLYVPDQQHTVPISGTTHASAVPMKAAALLRLGSELDQLVRVRGVITHSIPGEASYLKDSTGTLRILSAQPDIFVPGDEIEAEGFPQLESLRPALNATELRIVSHGPSPQPLDFDPADKLSTRLHHELVKGEARLLAVSESDGSYILQCQSGKKAFEAVLDRRLTPPLPEGISPGSLLQLTGLIELRPSRLFYTPDWIEGFRLHLRSGSDITILSQPPWWNVQRLVWLLLLILTLGGVAAAWVVMLQRTVRSQTLIIKEKVQRAAVLEERQRIAREMHDTFQQSLAGAGHLLDESVRRIQNANQDALEPLKLARQMLRRCREESRTSIAELRSVTLESRPFPEALSELLQPIIENSGITLSLKASPDLPSLDKALSHAASRIVQEAVTNAVRHSQGRNIQVDLTMESQELLLNISDDGTGFDPSLANALQGHFGITGMKERAAKLGGHIEITSSAGNGTVVLVRLPAVPPNLDEPLSNISV